MRQIGGNAPHARSMIAKMLDRGLGNTTPGGSGWTDVILLTTDLGTGLAAHRNLLIAKSRDATTAARTTLNTASGAPSQTLVNSATEILESAAESAGRNLAPRSASIFGQRPSVPPWRINPDGTVRTQNDIRAVLDRFGVRLPNDMEVYVGDAAEFYGTIDDLFAGRGALTARLPGLTEDAQGLVHFADLKNRFGKIPIRINPAMMQSDEAIAAVVTHEIHELSLFRRVFARRNGSMPFDAFLNEAAPNNPGNFHSQAWDAADRLILQIRGD